MALTINTNVMSLNAQRNTINNMQSLQTTMARLSSGLRVNTAKDDAAGLGIAERMNSQARGMSVALQNAADGISLTEVADGALSTLTDVLQRMRDLTLRAVNGTNGSLERVNLNQEFQQLSQELRRIRDHTYFNSQQILGSNAQAWIFQVGANGGQTISVQTVTPSIANAVSQSGSFFTLARFYVLSGTSIVASFSTQATALGSITGSRTLTTSGRYTSLINRLDDAIQSIVARRAELGAYMARFENIMTNLRVGIEKQTAARGRIMDADFAAETANLSRTQILQQAGTAMIAQANQLPQNVLRLLQG